MTCAIDFLPVRFSIQFDSPVTVDTQPLFVLRSVMGWKLKALCCIAHQKDCSSCLYNRTCAYSFLFETILPKDNAVQPGRIRASHPYTFSSPSQKLLGKEISSFDFTLTLFGKAVEYLPYIYASIDAAGKSGLFKSRTPFKITSVSTNCFGKRQELSKDGLLDVDVPTQTFEFKSESQKQYSGEVLVELLSPLRFKTGGKYSSDFDAQAFMSCLFRRLKTLCILYGTIDTDALYPGCGVEIAEKDIHWKEFTHYSSRQKNAMELGGFVGKLRLCGTFSELDVSLFEFNRLANAGKNTIFGLGQMDYWVKVRDENIQKNYGGKSDR